MKYNITYIQDPIASEQLCKRVEEELEAQYSDIAKEELQNQIAIAMALYISAQNCMAGFLKAYGNEEIQNNADVAFNEFLDKIGLSLEAVVKKQTAFKDN